MPRRKPILVSEIIALLLENGGITCRTQPNLYMWEETGKLARRIEIKTVPEFLSLFGNKRTYQVYIENPSIEYFGHGKFNVKSLSIVTTYLGGGRWARPSIQTDEEEITRDYSRGFKRKARRRASAISRRVQRILTILSIIFEAFSIIQELKR